MGFKKALVPLKNQGINPEQKTTDRHKQIRKYMREEEPTINHQFNVWHFVKNIKQKFLAASKKSSCKIIEKWIKAIGNHFWWSCATCNGDAELLREKRQLFSYAGMLTRSQLAIMDFNEGSNLEQATTGKGEKRVFKASKEREK